MSIDIPSLQARAELRKLGEDLSIARRRRGMTQRRVAEGAGLDVSTVRRLESGAPGVSLGALAMVLLVLGESGRLGLVMDVAQDDLGMALSIEGLPKRIRRRGGRRNTGTSKDDSMASAGDGEVF